MTAESNAAALLQEDESLEAADSTLKAALGATMTLIALTIVWELLVRQFQVPAWLLPSPSLIGQSMVEWRSELVGHSMVTLYETLWVLHSPSQSAFPWLSLSSTRHFSRIQSIPSCWHCSRCRRLRLRLCLRCGLDLVRCRRSSSYS